MIIPRRYIVPLTTKRKGAETEHELSLKRSYPTGVESFFRIYQGDELKINVDVLDTINCFNVRMVLHTNINTTDFAIWEDVPLAREGNRFFLTIRPDKPGSFRFKVRYSLDDGKTWLWDKVSHAYVIVDPAHMKDLKLYTLIPTRSGHIGQWREMLYYIKDLGFNAVHLLPVTAMGLSESPYAAKALFDIDEVYAIPGDKRPVLDQFEQDFVQTAKELNIRLCFDLVLNHICVDSEIVRRRPEWIKNDQKQKDGFKRAGCWDYQKWVVWGDLVLLNYDHPDEGIKAELWEYMKEYALFWANYASFTNGLVRLDNLHSSHYDFLRFMFREMRDAFPNILVFAELFSDFDRVKQLSVDFGINLLLATPWSEKFVPQLREYLEHIHRIGGHVRYLTPLNSHDSGSPAEEFGDARSTIPRYIAMALCAMPYTGLTQGAEIGVPTKVDFIGTAKEPPMDMNMPYVDFREFIKKINQIQEGYAAFGVTKNVTFIDDEHPAILGLHRRSPDPAQSDFIVLANFDIFMDQTITLDLSLCGIDIGAKPCMVTDLLSNMTFALQNSITLKPGEGKILRIER